MSLEEIVAAEIRVVARQSLPSMAWGLGGGTPEQACDRVELLVREARNRGLVVGGLEIDPAYIVRDWPPAPDGDGVLVDGARLTPVPGLAQVLVIRFSGAARACA